MEGTSAHQRPELIHDLMKTVNLGPEDVDMLREIVTKYPEAANNPEQLSQLIMQYQQRQGGVGGQA